MHLASLSGKVWHKSPVKRRRSGGCSVNGWPFIELGPAARLAWLSSWYFPETVSGAPTLLLTVGILTRHLLGGDKKCPLSNIRNSSQTIRARRDTNRTFSYVNYILYVTNLANFVDFCWFCRQLVPLKNTFLRKVPCFSSKTRHFSKKCVFFILEVKNSKF